MKQNLQFPDGKLAVKSINEVYADSNGNVTVDHVATADAIGSTTATQVADTVNKAHTHDNKTTLDKLADASGKLTYNGSEIGGTVDESRLLPALDSVPVDRSGNPVVFKAVSEGMDEHTLLYMPCEDYKDHSQYLRTVIQASGNSIAIDVSDKKFGAASLHGNGSNRAGVIAELPVAPFAADTTVHAWVKITDADDRCGIFDTYGAADGGSGDPGKGVGGIALWTHQGKLKAYKASAHFSSYWYDDDSGNLLVEADLPSDYLNRWMHVALVRSGLNWILFVDGVKLAENIKDFTPDKKFIRLAQHQSDAMTGNLDEFIILDYARWITDFEPPTQAATQVTKSYEVSDKGAGAVDESRLLPENPANGDIPCFDATATVGGGNDANTRLLLQPSTSDHGIVDQAAGNAAPVTLENHNVTVDEEGNMVFDGSNAYLKIPANTLPSDFFNGTDEWTLDIVYNVASKDMQCLFGCSSSLRMDFLLNSGGTLQIGGGPNLGTGWPFNEDVHLTFEIYKDGTVWKYTIFRNGSVVTTGTWVNADWRSVDQYIGWEGGTDSRKINGKIKVLRLTSGALHKGAAFQSDYPWTKPQTVGEWGLINKTSLVNSINGITPDDTGNVTLDLLTEEQLSKLNSIVLANDFTFTQSDIVSNMITKNATTLGVPAGSMVQVLSNTGIVMTERAGILVYWSGNNLIIDFTGYFNTTQTTLTGTWTVKFAGNFVGSGSGGSGTVAAIAYPIVLVKPAYTEAVHLEMVYATQDDYSDAQTLVNTKTTSADRSLVKAFGGTAWETCPSGGFGSVYDKKPVKIIVSSKLDATTIYNIKYRWISASSDTSVSDWYGMVYPCYSVSQ